MSSKSNQNKSHKKGDTIKEVVSQELTQKEKKKNRALIEAQRVAERDAMMDIPINNDEEGDDIMPHSSRHSERNVESAKESKFTVDKFGNTVSKAKLKEDAELEAMRSAARARRAEKELLKANSADSTTPNVSTKPVSLTAEETIAEIKSKIANNVKLTHKEKRLLQTHEQQSGTESSNNQLSEVDDVDGSTSSRNCYHNFDAELSAYMLSVSGRSFAGKMI
jgi:hypothetical protein